MKVRYLGSYLGAVVVAGQVVDEGQTVDVGEEEGALMCASDRWEQVDADGLNDEGDG